MQMSHYVNPELSMHSDYFKTLDKMMQCVEKNAHVVDVKEQARVCNKEFRNLRLAAFNQKLLYSEVNKRFFIRELAFKSGVSGW